MQAGIRLFGKIVESAVKRFAPFIAVRQFANVSALEQIAEQNIADLNELHRANICVSEDCLEKIWGYLERNMDLKTIAEKLSKEMHQQLGFEIKVAFFMDFFMILINLINIWRTCDAMRDCAITHQIAQNFIQSNKAHWNRIIDIISNWDTQERIKQLNTGSEVGNQLVEVIDMLRKVDVEIEKTRGQRNLSIVIGMFSLPFILTNFYLFAEAWEFMSFGYKIALSATTSVLTTTTILQFYGVYSLNEWMNIMMNQSKTLNKWYLDLRKAHEIANKKVDLG